MKIKWKNIEKETKGFRHPGNVTFKSIGSFLPGLLVNQVAHN
jgi:hypothetical protein